MEIYFFSTGKITTTVDSSGEVRNFVIPDWVLAACPEPEFDETYFPRTDLKIPPLKMDNFDIDEDGGGYSDFFCLPPVPQADLDRAKLAFAPKPKRKFKAKSRKKRR